MKRRRPVEGMTVGECRIISVKCLSCSETWVLLYRKEGVKETNSYLMHFCFVFRFAKTYLSSVWRLPVFDARPCFCCAYRIPGHRNHLLLGFDILYVIYIPMFY